MTQGRGEDRYIVRELTGYGIGPKATTHSNQKAHTDVYIMDRLNCYHVVRSYPASHARGDLDIRERRLSAVAQANLWNQEHRAWLHAGRWSDGRVS